MMPGLSDKNMDVETMAKNGSRCVHSTYSKTSSKDVLNILAILNASASEGTYFPCSRATIV